MNGRSRWASVVAVGVVVAVVAAAATSVAGAQQRKPLDLGRATTLYTSGTAWGPYAQFNPLRSSGNATGTLGLLYETLFRYDPINDKYIPVSILPK